MTRPTPGRPFDGLDPMTVAGGFGTIAGILSVRFPFFVGLVVALSALFVLSGLIAWAHAGRPTSVPRWTLVGVFVLAGGWVAFLAGGALLDSVRGLVLGVGSLPLLWSMRSPYRRK